MIDIWTATGAAIVLILMILLYFIISTPEKASVPPQCLNDTKWGNHAYAQLEGGLKMHYVERGDKDKPLMLFLHGFPEFWYSWRYQLLHHSGKYWCVAPDLRGYGETDKPDGVSNYSLNHLTEDVKHLIEVLGRSKCILVGHDWGGAIGYAFCTRYANMIDAYIAINTFHPLSLAREIVNNKEQRLKTWYIGFFQIPFIPEYRIVRVRDRFLIKLFKNINVLTSDSGTTPEDMEAYIYAFREQHTWKCAINYYRALARYSFFTSDHPLKIIFKPDIYKDFKKITVPVHSIFGTGDDFISIKTVQGCADFCEDFEEALMEDVEHFSHQEAPERVNSLMDLYLNQRGL